MHENQLVLSTGHVREFRKEDWTIVGNKLHRNYSTDWHKPLHLDLPKKWKHLTIHPPHHMMWRPIGRYLDVPKSGRDSPFPNSERSVFLSPSPSCRFRLDFRLFQLENCISDVRAVCILYSLTAPSTYVISLICISTMVDLYICFLVPALSYRQMVCILNSQYWYDTYQRHYRLEVWRRRSDRPRIGSANIEWRGDLSR